MWYDTPCRISRLGESHHTTRLESRVILLDSKCHAALRGEAGRRYTLASLILTVWLSSDCRAQPSMPLADWLRLTGRYEEAAEIYRTQMRTDRVRAAKGWARCHASVGKTTEAGRMFCVWRWNRARIRRPTDRIGSIAVRTRKLCGAQTLVDSSLLADPIHASACWLQAELHRVHGRLDQARQSCESLVRHYDRPESIDDPETSALGRVGHGPACPLDSRQSYVSTSGQLDWSSRRRNSPSSDFCPAHVDAAMLLLPKIQSTRGNR